MITYEMSISANNDATLLLTEESFYFDNWAGYITLTLEAYENDEFKPLVEIHMATGKDDNFISATATFHGIVKSELTEKEYDNLWFEVNKLCPENLNLIRKQKENATEELRKIIFDSNN